MSRGQVYVLHYELEYPAKPDMIPSFLALEAVHGVGVDSSGCELLLEERNLNVEGSDDQDVSLCQPGDGSPAVSPRRGVGQGDDVAERSTLPVERARSRRPQRIGRHPKEPSRPQ
jgi:hypothetical protein